MCSGELGHPKNNLKLKISYSNKYRFLRSVAYREFTRLIHGRLRDKRTPLPASAYHAIRSTFPSGEEYTGYSEDDDEEEEEEDEIDNMEEDFEVEEEDL